MVENNPKSRWKEIRRTSPSGKAMFVCLSCGTVTPVPTEECSELVITDYKDMKVRMPCSAWPMSPDDYIGKRVLEVGEEAFFTGVVILPEGEYHVASMMPVDVGRALAVKTIERDLNSQMAERKRRETRELVMDEVVSGTVPMKAMLDEVNKVIGDPQTSVDLITNKGNRGY